MARRRVKGAVCPNCDHPLHGDDNFCPRCGQENHTHKLPVRHFVVELLSGLFNFDTKLLRTLRDLFWPPGLVIQAYNANKRARYVPPLRLYLFTSVLFFLLLGWTTHQGPEKDPVVVEADGADTHGLNLGMEHGTISDSTITALSRHRELTTEIVDSALVAAGETPGIMTRAMLRMAVGMSVNSFRTADFLDQLIGTFSKLLFLLVPFFALFLKVLYRRSKNYYSEHLVFALYFHTLLFIILGVVVLIGEVADPPFVGPILIILMLTHLFLSLRTVYREKAGKTVLKTTLIVLGYGLVLVLALVTSAVVGALTI